MSTFINKILLKGSFFKEFPAITIGRDGIQEQVFLVIDGVLLNVSDCSWPLSLTPMIWGVWLKQNDPTTRSTTSCTLHLQSRRKQILAAVSLVLHDRIIEDEGTLYLFTTIKSEIAYTSKLKAHLIYWRYYKHKKTSFDQFKSLAAAFSYPRQVHLISFQEEKYFNIFPMDFVGMIPGTNRIALGLRHTNTTLLKIIETKKVVVSKIPSTLINEVYALSRHHAGNPLSVDELPFAVNSTELYNFPVPQSAILYDEVELQTTLNLGSHMLLWGKIVNTVSMNEEHGKLYHVHFLAYLDQKLKHPSYTLLT